MNTPNSSVQAVYGTNLSNNAQGRGFHADPSLQALFSASTDAGDAENNHKAKLYELFVLIEKEFDALFYENCALRARIAESSNEKTVEPNLINDSTPANAGGAIGTETQIGRQKWKTAFRGPPGRLVTSLKVGGGNFEATKHRFVRTYSGHLDGVWHVASASLGSHQFIASASADHTARIWLADDSAQCVVNYVGHSGSVNSIAAKSTHGDHFLLLTTSGDRQSHIWKANLGHVINGSGGGGGYSSVVSTFDENDDSPAVNPQGSGGGGSGSAEKSNDDINGGGGATDGILPSSSSAQLMTVVQQPLMRLTGHSEAVIAGEWIFGGEHLITASWDRTANVYDTETGKVINVLTGHDQELTHCSAHQSQKLVATASKDFTFRLWDFREQIQSVAVFQGHNDAVTSVVFTSMHHIASGSDDRTTKVWDLRNMRSPMTTIRLNSPVNTLSVCHKYNLIAIPQDGRHISIYDLHGMRLARLPRTSGKCHHRMVCCATWLSDNPVNNLVTCGFDRQIIGWKVHTGAPSNRL